jgi:hypothetical protein
MPEIGMAHLHKDKVYFMKLTKCEKDAFAYNTELGKKDFP